MTRAAQKEQEEQIVECYMKARGLRGRLEIRETPDFALHVDGAIIGIEVVVYHSNERGEGGYTRRQVEAEWDAIREAVRNLRKNYRIFDDLSIYVEFSGLRVPGKNERNLFIRELAKMVENHQPISNLILSPNDFQRYNAPICSKYLESLRIKHVGCYMELDWNHDVGWIGSTEDEIIPMIFSKNEKLGTYNCENIVLVIGSRNSLSQMMGIFCLEELIAYKELADALRKSIFDEVCIIDEQVYLWRRSEASWSVLALP